MIEYLLSPETIYALGWTLIHTLWQGALFACLLAVALIILRNYSAQARYVIAVGLLSGFLLTAIFTFVQLNSAIDTTEIVFKSKQKNKTSSNQATESITPPVNTTTEHPEVSTIENAQNLANFRQRMVKYYDDNLPLIVTLWLLGVLVLLLRMLGQLAYVQRLRSYGVTHFPERWRERIQDLEDRLEISRNIQYALSYRVQSPFTFGWLHPVVLFPTGLFKDLEDTQIYAILAHELAHIKRDDYLVNIIQQLLLTLFFYHPGLWWMSARIEEEREHSCDDLAIQITEQPIGYAKTLLQLTEAQLHKSQLAMAYTGNFASTDAKGFKMRITRLLSKSFAKSSYSEGVATALILVITFGVAVGVRGYAPTDTTPLLIEDTTSNIVALSNENPQEEETQIVEDIDMDFEADNEEEKVTSNDDDTLQPNDENFELFIEAIDDGNLKLVKYFIENGVDVNQLTRRGWSPLMVAASENHSTIASVLLENGAQVNFMNSQGWTALSEAADEGAYDTAKILIAAGAKTNISNNEEGISPLAVAASEGYLNIIELLLESGANLSSSDNYQPLHVAAEEGHLDIVKFFISKGVDVDQRDFHQRTALSYAAEERQTIIAQFLIENGADISLRDEEGHSALDYAAEENAGEIVELLLNTPIGRKMIRKNVDALIQASDEGALSVVRKLIENGANVNASNRDALTPLMAAAAEGEYETVSYLLDVGADIEATSSSLDWTPLLLAAKEGESSVVRLLLEKGADTEASCTYRSINYSEDEDLTLISFYKNATPLMIAIEEDEEETIEVLIKNGADINVTISKSQLLVPERYSWEELVNFDMDDNSANKVMYDVTGWTLLMEAVECDNYNIIRLLLDAGVDKNMKTNTGITALSLAKKTGDRELINLLSYD